MLMPLVRRINCSSLALLVRLCKIGVALAERSIADGAWVTSLGALRSFAQLYRIAPAADTWPLAAQRAKCCDWGFWSRQLVPGHFARVQAAADYCLSQLAEWARAVAANPHSACRDLHPQRREAEDRHALFKVQAADLGNVLLQQQPGNASPGSRQGSGSDPARRRPREPLGRHALPAQDYLVAAKWHALRRSPSDLHLLVPFGGVPN